MWVCVCVAQQNKVITDSIASLVNVASIRVVSSKAITTAMNGKNSRSLRPNYYKQELASSSWDVPIRYQDLRPVGNGVSGQVCSKLYMDNQDYALI